MLGLYVFGNQSFFIMDLEKTLTTGHIKYELLSFSLVKITKVGFKKIIFRLFRNILTFDFQINFLDSIYSILKRISIKH